MNQRDRDELEDLAFAREMQRALLPEDYPVFPVGVSAEQSALRFAHYFEPTGHIGGDLFDIIALSQTRVAVFICDVMGHGVRAALCTGIILGMLRQLLEETRNPARLLTRLNHRLSQILSRMPEGIFTTAFLFVLDSADGTMTYANAGHPTPLLLKKSSREVQWLDDERTRRGAALALFPQRYYENATIKLDEGDRILLYTDGITETLNPERHEFDPEGLRLFAQAHHKSKADEFITKLMTKLKEFSGSTEFDDDVCLVWIELDHYLKYGRTANEPRSQRCR